MIRPVYIRPGSPKNFVKIGDVKECGATRIIFDASTYEQEPGEKSYRLYFKNPAGVGYWRDMQLDGTDAIYDVRESDTVVHGLGELQIEVRGADGTRMLFRKWEMYIDGSIPEEMDRMLGPLAPLVEELEELRDPTVKVLESESKRVQAENTRAEAESSRADAETARVAAEKQRASAETTRASSETARVEAETKRAQAEKARAEAETARKDAETARVAAEKQRASVEMTRASSETARAEAETKRIEAEKVRDKKIEQIEGETNQLKEDVGVLKGTPNYVRGFKLLRDGSCVTADGLCVSDSIAVTSGNNVTVTAGEYQAENLIFVFYDANGTFVDYFGMVNMESRIAAVPQNATSLKVTFVDGYSARVCDNGTMDNMWEVGFNSGVFYEIDQLRKEIRETEYLPKYYFSDNYITSKVNEINSIIKSCASNGDAFFFITDEHWELNARNSPMLVKYLHDKCNITRLFDGGDRYNGYDEYRVDCLLREAMGSDRVYPVVGNHEYLLGGTNNDAFATSFIHITDAVWGEQGKPYYFVDNNQQKIRYIMLQAFDEHQDGSVGASIGYSDAELAWLQNTALNVEHGWVIIIFTHSMLAMNDNTKTVGVPSGRFKMAYDIINNYDGEGTIACVIMGHAHWDKKHTTSSGVQMIVTTCDKYDLSKEPGLEQDTRTPGTISEQAFEVVVLDKQNRKITFVRIGNPINDIDEPDTQKRVITY